MEKKAFSVDEQEFCHREEDVEKKLKTKADIPRLTRALIEIVETEREYVRRLEETISVFLCVDAVQSHLGCLRRLLRTQKKMLDSVESACAPVISSESSSVSHEIAVESASQVCGVFSKFSSHLKVYAEYAAAYLRLQKTITEDTALLKELECLNNGGEHSSSWESCMIRPIQRVTQYPLLLSSLEAAAPSLPNLSHAMTRMRALVVYVNEMQRIEEHLSQRLHCIRTNHAHFLISKGMRMEMGELLMFMRVVWFTATTEIECFLFAYSSLLLLLPANSTSQESVLLPMEELETSKGACEDELLLLHCPLLSGEGERGVPLSPSSLFHTRLPPYAKKHLLRHIHAAKAASLRRTTRPPSDSSSKSDCGYASEQSPLSVLPSPSN